MLGGSGNDVRKEVSKGKRLGGSGNENHSEVRERRGKAIKSKQNGGTKRQPRNKRKLYKQNSATTDSLAPRAHMLCNGHLFVRGVLHYAKQRFEKPGQGKNVYEIIKKRYGGGYILLNSGLENQDWGIHVYEIIKERYGGGYIMLSSGL